VAGQWRDRLFPTADDNQFADAYAQVLTYALLLARLSGAADLTPDRAANILDERSGLLAQTLRLLGDQPRRPTSNLGTVRSSALWRSLIHSISQGAARAIPGYTFTKISLLPMTQSCAETTACITLQSGSSAVRCV
jgi:hypothetical protein